MTESKIPLKLVLGGVRSVALSISFHDRLNKLSMLFWYHVGSLYSKRLGFPDYLEVDLVKLLPVHRYSVDMMSCSDPSGILGYDGEQNTTISLC